MKICFPVEENIGLESLIYYHFGSAPLYMVADTDTGQATLLQNNDQQHHHEACSPLQALGGYLFDGIVVGGIGSGILNGLLHMGLKVFQAAEGSIAKNVDLLLQGILPELTHQQTCDEHSHGVDFSH